MSARWSLWCMLSLLGVGCGSEEAFCPEETTLRVEEDGEGAQLLFCETEDGVLHGPRQRVFKGTPIWKEHFEQGVLHGLKVRFDQNQPVIEIPYVQGEREGTARGWYPDGKRLFEGGFQNDLAEGSWQFFVHGGLTPRYAFDMAKGVPVWTQEINGEDPLDGSVPEVGTQVLWTLSLGPADGKGWRMVEGVRITDGHLIIGPDTNQWQIERAVSMFNQLEVFSRSEDEEGVKRLRVRTAFVPCGEPKTMPDAGILKMVVGILPGTGVKGTSAFPIGMQVCARHQPCTNWAVAAPFHDAGTGVWVFGECS